MKVLLFTDVHWSTNTSIVRSRGINYSKRLELLIESMNWVNKLAKDEKCNIMICAGDMMDKSFCSDEEITALREIKWSDLSCFFLVGNHESSVKDLHYSSTNLLNMNNFYIVDVPMSIIMGDSLIDLIPYLKDTEDTKMIDLVSSNSKDFKKHIVVSHNDIKGIQYGAYISKIGLSVDDIEANCDLFLNGHLHNQAWVTKKILNLGSLTAHNFTNDSFKYKYGAWVLDTDTLGLEFFENPYSLNFYKFDIEELSDLTKFSQLKDNSVLAIKYKESMSQLINKEIDKLGTKIIAYKNSIVSDEIPTDCNCESNIITIDYLKSFSDYVINIVGNSEVVKEELQQVLGEV